MHTSDGSSTSPAQAGPRSSSNPLPWRPAATLLAAVLMVVALVGPGWLHVPADPATGAPAMTLDFGALHDLFSSDLAPTTWLQQTWFAWLAWVLVLITIGAAVAHAVLRVRGAALTVIVVGVLGLVLDTFALKGALTWSQLIDQVPNVRPGAYLLVVGYVIAIGSVAGRATSRRG